MAWIRKGFNSPRVHNNLFKDYLTILTTHGILRTMENESPQTAKSGSKTPLIIIVAVIALIAVAAIGYSMTRKPDAMQEQTTIPTTTEKMESQPTAADTMEAASYKDGEYKAEGNYTSPGGAESLDVTLTLAGGVVTDAEVISNATRPISKQMQASFIGGFKEQVIGKNIDEINLTKVSASSLAPKGFNNAVEEIKTQART